MSGPAGRIEACLLCGTRAVVVLHDIPSLPLCLHAVAPERQTQVPRLPFRAGVCCSCAHLQQVAIPPADVVEAVYTQFFGTYQSTVKTGIGGLRAARFLEFLSAHAPLRGSALEVGCFDGHFLSLLRERGCAVVGCDPSAGADIARTELGLDVRREFFSDQTFSKPTFDLFVARQVLEHIERPVEFLASARRALRPGGWLALELPDADLWLAQGVLGSLFHEHVSYYTEATLRALVEAAGFDVVGIEHRHTDLFLVARATTRPAQPIATRGRSPHVDGSRDLLLAYARRTSQTRAAVQAIVGETHRRGGRVVLCGAGVHSASMVAAFGLTASDVDLVVDDNPVAQDKVLPNLEQRRIASPSVLRGASAADAVIVSGFSFQEEMLARLERLNTNARVFRLYPTAGEVVCADLAGCASAAP